MDLISLHYQNILENTPLKEQFDLSTVLNQTEDDGAQDDQAAS